MNFDTLLRVKADFKILVIISIVLLLIFPELSSFSFFAIIISLYQFFLLFSSIGHVMPIRYLFGAFMCLQMLVGPILAYNGLDIFQFPLYRMQIPEAVYFSYVIPAVVAFILGLHMNAGKLDGEILNEKGIENFIRKNKNLPYLFIAIGFIASILAEMFSSDLAFLFFLLGGLKFIGVFLIIIGKRQLRIIPLIIVYASIIASSLGEGMFHDLLTWLIFLGCVFAIKYRPGSNMKRVVVISFVFLTLAIQQLKGSYRDATLGRGEQAGLGTMSKAYAESQSNNTFFSFQSLASSNVRFNQGFIITYIMGNVPNKIPYANGSELYKIIEAALLPRILAPDKLNAGDREFFMKYSGMLIAKGTSMGLSSVGDGYINFGPIGGCVFMFFLGLLFNEVLKAFYRYSKYFPLLLLFTPLVFYYPIRPDCELQTILGHLVKSSFLIYIIFLFWRKYFKVQPSNT